MVTSHSDTCGGRCQRRTVVAFRTDPPEAFRTVVLNRWRLICPACFDQEAEKAGVRYTFTDLAATAWSELAPRHPRRKR